MMLRELDAFEACWLDLKDVHPTSCTDNMLIAHAMGQLVDLLEKPAQVEQALPNHLKSLFRQLALAYFQGYFPGAARQGAAMSTRVPAPPPPQGAGQRRQDISAAVSQVKALAHTTQARIRQGRGQAAQLTRSEMETLVIDFPEHW